MISENMSQVKDENIDSRLTRDDIYTKDGK